MLNDIPPVTSSHVTHFLTSHSCSGTVQFVEHSIRRTRITLARNI